MVTNFLRLELFILDVFQPQIVSYFTHNINIRSVKFYMPLHWHLLMVQLMHKPLKCFSKIILLDTNWIWTQDYRVKITYSTGAPSRIWLSRIVLKLYEYFVFWFAATDNPMAWLCSKSARRMGKQLLLLKTKSQNKAIFDYVVKKRFRKTSNSSQPRPIKIQLC